MPARLKLPKWPTLNLEREIGGIVCGVDEAGCAPLAGPVVAAAVILPEGPKPRQLRGINDSKLLTEEKREKYFDVIHRVATVGVGMASVEEIDRLNIYHADMLAMRRAVEALSVQPDAALVDGRGRPPLPCSVTPIIKGDRRSLSVACASIIAKVVRDRLMRELAEQFPYYGWHSNVGYPTDVHYLGLLRKGPSEHHRRSFAPMNTLFAPDSLALVEYRFGPIDRPALDSLDLLFLREDLRAVFDDSGHHIGIVRKLRSGWIFHAVGYGDDREPLDSGGPCARWHGACLAGPERSDLLDLFSS